MKYLAAALALVCAGAFAEPRTPPPPAPALRQVVQQYDAVRKTAPPRQLSAAERAELRRQVSEYGQGGRRR